MQFSRILVRAANWVGDAVMSLPALGAIRARFPEAHIAVLARPWVADLYAREPFADMVIPYTAERGANDLAGKWRAAADLRARKFDCAILLQNAFEAAALAWLARIPRRIGYDRDGRGLLLTDAVPVPKPGEIGRHQRFYYLELLRRAGVVSGFSSGDTVRLVGVARSATGEAWVGVSPGAAYGSAKRWPPESFAEAAVEVASKIGAPVALFGSADERLLCEQVERLIAGRARVVNFAGQTSLRQFIDLAAACRVFLTNDSGAMHIASALGVPTVAVFGATDDDATGPAGEFSRIVREPVDCSPCLLRECPIDHRCMTRVAAGRVAHEALELLK
ncbi:MAG: lipopolysaccharide heptosyltransferase II [Bryobacterales bacterium]|nr:lipopolysaccharide heptosyltransferase II [Bryobacterales bacterium]